MSDGFNTRDGIPTPQQIAENIDKVLIPEPDLEIMEAFKFE